MKKHYFLAAALIGFGFTISLFTSCQKDYDGQLEIIRNQIKNGTVSLDGLKEKITLIEKQIKELQDAIANGDNLNKEEIQKVIDDLNATKADLNGKITELQEQINKNSDDIKDLKNLIDATSQEFNDKLLKISERINGIDTSINVLDGRVAKLENQVQSLENKQLAVEESINDLRIEIAGLGSDMEEQKVKLEGALQKLEALDQKLTQEVDRMKQKVDEVKQATETNAANLEALRQETAKQFADLKESIDNQIQDLANQMAGVSETVVSLGNQVYELNQKYDNLSEELNQIQGIYNLQIKKIWEKINSMSPGQDGEVGELTKLVTELQNNLNELRKSMQDEFKRVLETQALFGQDLQRVEDTVRTHTEKLNNLDEKLKELDVKVTRLEQTVIDMKAVYDKTLDEIEVRLQALENQSGSGDAAMVEQLKKDLVALKEEVKRQAQEIVQIKDNQQKQAEKMTGLQNYVTTSILAMQGNLNKLSERVDGLEDLIVILNKNLEDSNKKLGELNAQVTEHTKQIAALWDKINSMQQGPDGYITREEVEAMLENYYDKDEIDQKFKEVYLKLDDCATLDEVKALIQDATEGMQQQLDKMQESIDKLSQEYSELRKDVEMLMNRIQSFELVADYNDGTIKVTKKGINQYQLEMTVEVTPEELTGKLQDLKGIISLRCRDVVPVRSKASEVNFVIEKVQAVKGALVITANFNLDKDYETSQALPYQVAVVLEDSNNFKLSEYRGMRLEVGDVVDSDKTYLFKTGEKFIQTAEGINLSDFKQFTQLNVLANYQNQTQEVIQVDGSNELYTEGVQAVPKENTQANAKNVIFKYVIAYDKQGNSQPDLNGYIGINALGEIYMIKSLPAGLIKSLLNYKIVVSMQATENGTLYGKKEHVCFELRMKDGNN